MFEDASGAIWVGTVEGGVAELKNGKWRGFRPGEGISLGQVLGFAEGQGAPLVAISDCALIATNVALGTPAVTLSTIARFVETGKQTSVSAIVTGVPQVSSVPLPGGSVQFYDSLDGAAA